MYLVDYTKDFLKRIIEVPLYKSLNANSNLVKLLNNQNDRLLNYDYSIFTYI